MAEGNVVNRLVGRGALITGLVIGAIVFCIFAVHQSFVNVDAGEIVVIQAPISGQLTVVSDPGWKWRGFGAVTSYPRRAQFSFSSRADQGKDADESITTRFNDGGHANISGTINWSMPLSPDKVIALHKDFHSFQAIEQQLIRTQLQKVIYNVGPTMSSTESSAERRPEIPKYIDDQMVNGPYLTRTVQQMIDDPITNQPKQVAVVQIATGADGRPLRESISQISRYGIILQPVSINQIKYDDVVENQIKQRQDATTQVQISIANAKKAEQQAITTAKEGEAAAAKAKWEQETLNAKDIAEAEKNKQVAELAVATAAAKKQALILEGEGEAAKRKAILLADGALEKKLDAYVKVNEAYADAIKNANAGAWTPSVIMGGAGGGNQVHSGASSLVDMLTAKTASELGLDRTITQGAKAKH